MAKLIWGYNMGSHQQGRDRYLYKLIMGIICDHTNIGMDSYVTKLCVSNKFEFQRACWARGLKSLRARTNVDGSKGNNLNLKAYKINAWIFLISSASMCILDF